MVGQDIDLFIETIGRACHEGGHDLRMESTPSLPQQAAVDDLMGQRMLESQRALGKVPSLV
jgi:hypothetical protein